MSAKNFFLFLGSLLFYTLVIEGCHSPQHLRRKRQVFRNDTDVDETRSLRDFFSACMLDRAGPAFVWESVIDFSILDTLWYENTNDDVCRNDTVSCWQQRLLDYLRPNSNYLPIARSCILQLDIDVEKSGRIEYRGSRKKRSASYYPKPTTNPEIVLLQRYSSCVRGRIRLPRNRRSLNVDSLVNFVRENTFCGECSDSNKVYGHRRATRSSSSSASFSFSSFSSSSSSGSLSHSSSYYNNPYNNNFPRRQPAAIAPFKFLALTRRQSVLSSPISQCNRDFLPLLVPSGDDVPVVGWSAWSSWGDCPAPCGRRVPQVRERTCPLGIPGVDPCIGSSTERRFCERANCPEWSRWSSWSGCSVTCGRKSQTSTRRCVNGVAGQNGCIGRRQRSRLCSLPPCFGTWTTWTSWSRCSSTCGTGNRFRRRNCPPPHLCLPDKNGNRNFQAERCNTLRCRKSWSNWGSWSKCHVSCGGSRTFSRRQRVCRGDQRLADCEGSNVQNRKCGRQKCPGPSWSNWSSWSECVYRKRSRHCVGGSSGSCPGSNVDYIRGSNCGNHRNDHWSRWSNWSTCKGNCHFAQQKRRRSCQRNTAQRGCLGNNFQSQQCRPHSCLKGKK